MQNLLRQVFVGVIKELRETKNFEKKNCRRAESSKAFKNGCAQGEFSSCIHTLAASSRNVNVLG